MIVKIFSFFDDDSENGRTTVEDEINALLKKGYRVVTCAQSQSRSSLTLCRLTVFFEEPVGAAEVSSGSYKHIAHVVVERLRKPVSSLFSQSAQSYAVRLNNYGIKTVFDLASRSRSELVALGVDDKCLTEVEEILDICTGLKFREE